MAYVFYLDRYHLGDPLFLNRFARDLATLRAPKLVVHGTGEEAERVLEAEGRFVTWEGDVPSVETLEERSVVERATRDLNRRVAHALNEAGVPAVRVDGASRGLLEADAGSTPPLANAEWLLGLVRQGGVPVVAALGPGGEGGLRPVSGGHLASQFAQAIGGCIILFGRGIRSGVERGGERVDSVEEGAVAASVFAEPEAVRAALATGVRVLLTGPAGVSEGGVAGTEVVPEGERGGEKRA